MNSLNLTGFTRALSLVKESAAKKPLRAEKDKDFEARTAAWNKQKPAELPGRGLDQLSQSLGKNNLQPVELPAG